MVVTEILDDFLTKTDNVKVGDVITKINDKTISEIILENRSLIGGSNEASYLYNLVEPVLSGYSENIKLDFLVQGKSITKTINWVDYNFNRHVLKKNPKNIYKKEKFRILENNIGYVNMGILDVKNIPEMIEKLNPMKAIIFDMRNYPNGTYEETSKFLNANEKNFAIYTKPDLTYPGRFKWSEPHPTGSENKNNYKGKIVILLN